MVMPVGLEDVALQPSPARSADAILPPMDEAADQISDEPADEGLSKEGENEDGGGLCWLGMVGLTLTANRGIQSMDTNRST